MKRMLSLLLCLSLLMLCACGSRNNPDSEQMQPTVDDEDTQQSALLSGDSVQIVLSDGEITVDGTAIGTDESAGVWAANDIVYYPEGTDFTFGKGEPQDMHSAEEADAHTVVHIGKSGTYVLSGQLSAGQIAVDLGEDAKEDPEAVVNLVLDGVDLTCTVAPAIMFYRVYECGSSDPETATAEVDTSDAGANLILAEGSENTVRGSYVARIYKEETVELSEDGTEVLSAKKLHKYDGAVYSRMSINVSGDGSLFIDAQNEGLDSELHLTILGGNIRIESGNDGINTNEDGVSVTRVSGGRLEVLVTGETGEGDGIDSNGWLVIDGGTVIAQACSTSQDSGLDADCGIEISGNSTVIATGNMFDAIEETGQTFCVFTFRQSRDGGEYTLRTAEGETLCSASLENSFRYLVFTLPELEPGEYCLYSGDTPLLVEETGGMGGPGAGMRPVNMDGMPEPPGDEGSEMIGGEPPEKPGEEAPEAPETNRQEPPELPDGEMPMLPDGEAPELPGDFNGEQMPETGEQSECFTVKAGANYYSVR